MASRGIFYSLINGLLHPLTLTLLAILCIISVLWRLNETEPVLGTKPIEEILEIDPTDWSGGE